MVKLLPLIESVGELPAEIKVSIGWPSGKGLAKYPVVGQCWPPLTSAGVAQVFISPRLTDPYEVAAVLLHELIHAKLPPDVFHKGPFKKAHAEVGFIDKPTHSSAGEELAQRLKTLVEALPEMPHVPLTVPEKVEKPQTNRQLKLTCPVHPKYIVRASKKTIGTAPPLCGLCALDKNPTLTPMQEPPALEIGDPVAAA